MNAKRLTAIVLLYFIIIAGVYYFYEHFTMATFKLKGYDFIATPHFIILFRPESKDSIPTVANAAEKAYETVGKYFDFYPKGKTPIVVFPDSISLQAAFNWPRDENTQGVYFRGVIYVQSPDAWIGQDQDMAKVFFEKGPMVHEYTHLVVDALTLGNHPRWFTEGPVWKGCDRYTWLKILNRPEIRFAAMRKSCVILTICRMCQCLLGCLR